VAKGSKSLLLTTSSMKGTIECEREGAENGRFELRERS